MCGNEDFTCPLVTPPRLSERHVPYGLGIIAGKMKLEFLENPSSNLLGYSRISNLIHAHFWEFLEIACWYWPDLAIIQAPKLGLGIISLKYKQKCGIQAFPTP